MYKFFLNQVKTVLIFLLVLLNCQSIYAVSSSAGSASEDEIINYYNALADYPGYEMDFQIGVELAGNLDFPHAVLFLERAFDKLDPTTEEEMIAQFSILYSLIICAAPLKNAEIYEKYYPYFFIFLEEWLKDNDRVEYAKGCKTLAATCAELENYDMAFMFNSMAIEALEPLVEEDNLLLLETKYNLAQAYKALDMEGIADLVIDELLQICLKHGHRDEFTAQLLIQKGHEAYRNQLNLGGALEILLNAKDMLEELPSLSNPSLYASALQDIALVYLSMGLHQEAADYSERASQIMIEQLKMLDMIPEAAVYLKAAIAQQKYMQSRVSYGLGMMERALEDIDTALEIFSNPIINDHDYIMYQTYKASILIVMNRSDEAEKILKDALKYAESNRPDASDIFVNLYYYLSFSNGFKKNPDIKEAHKYLDKGMQAYRSGNRDNSSEMMPLLNWYAYLGFLENNSSYDLKPVETLSSIIKDNITDNMFTLTETERESYWNYFGNVLQAIIAVTSVADKGEELLYDAILLNKGLLLNTSRGISEIIEKTNDKNLKNKFDNLSDQKRKLMTMNDKSSAEYSTLVKEIEKDERDILRQLNDYDVNPVSAFSLSWKYIRRRLKDHELAVEFASFADSRDSLLTAVIIRKDFEKPVVIRYDAPKLLNLIKTQRERLYTDPYFSDLLWTPVKKFMNEGDVVYFSPDGILNDMAIEYFPVDESGVPMADKYKMFRLSSTSRIGNIVEEMSDIVKDAVVFGGLDFSGDIDMIEAEFDIDRSDVSQRGVRFIHSDKLDNVFWRDLPATYDEALSIESVLKSNGISTRLYAREKGSEDNFKHLSGNAPGILHIATHGFFLPEKEQSAMTLNVPGGENFFFEDESLNRSGLVFAGVNNSKQMPEYFEDGILSGTELSKLNLSGTELTVLSACQTGRGDIIVEGISGLPRALKKAGVKSILMSLWDVNDEATETLMTAFYRNLFNGMTKHEALREAQHEVKAKSFIDPDGKMVSGSDPLYWASFILLD